MVCFVRGRGGSSTGGMPGEGCLTWATEPDVLPMRSAVDGTNVVDRWGTSRVGMGVGSNEYWGSGGGRWCLPLVLA